MMMGRHLQKVYNNHEKGFTTPIINGTDGRKMSNFGNLSASQKIQRTCFENSCQFPMISSLNTSHSQKYHCVKRDENIHGKGK
jgi:tyrosyl-tRNA synthetase